jgi:serine/threonine-protein kinase
MSERTIAAEPERRRLLEAALTEYDTLVASRRLAEAQAVLTRDPDLRDDLERTIASRAPASAVPSGDATDPRPGGATDVTISQAAATGSGRKDLPPGTAVRYFGDYELLDVLGRGGMGVVYRARQMTLNRQVALKMIRAGLLAGDDELRRFQNEAEAVALLDHPGIVPVHEVGEFDGQRYFSMKLVEGGNLADRLETYRSDPRASAALVAEVADAVHHAHVRGVLHRDLKPANVLVDARGRPHVTDFGLAKRVGEDAGMTLSGAILGTPAYMAPEQAAGHRGSITTATDVYGLGAILYAMLAGRAPFVGDSVVETLEQVRTRSPEPPTRLNGDVPRDLETICLKCLAKDPRQRYASAGALADDLRRWLAGEPIAARPVGPARRAWMWARRKPVLAGLAAGLAVSLVGGFVGMATLWRAAVAQRNLAVSARDDAVRSQRLATENEKAARQAEAEAVASRTQAEQNAQTAGAQATLALNATQDLITQVTNKLTSPGLLDLKEALLKSALARVDTVANVYEKSTSKEATTAAALIELGRIYRNLGQTDKAYQNVEKALAILRQRIIIKKGSDASRRNLALGLSDLAALSEERDRDLKAALAHYEEAMRLYEDVDANPMLADSPTPKPLVRYELSEVYKLVGVTHHRVGDMRTALDYYRKAYDVFHALVPGTPEEASDDRLTVRKYYLSKTKTPLAVSVGARRTGDRDTSNTYLDEAIAWGEAYLKAEPNSVEARANLSDVLFNAGEYALFDGDAKKARPFYERSRLLRGEIVEAEPRNVFYRRMLAVADGRLGNVEVVETGSEAAGPAFAWARETMLGIVADGGTNDRVEMTLMVALAHSGDVDRALEIADRLASAPKADPELKVDAARVNAQVATHLPPDRAAARKDKAVDLVREAAEAGFTDHVYLEGEPDLAPVRDDPRFRALLDRMRAPKVAGP